jgi:AraC family transcriptional regulator
MSAIAAYAVPEETLAALSAPCFTATHQRLEAHARGELILPPASFTIPLRAVRGLAYHAGNKPLRTVDVEPGTVLANGAHPLRCVRWDSPLDCVRVELAGETVERSGESDIPSRASLRLVDDPVLYHIGSLLRAEIEARGASGPLFAASLGALLMSHIDWRYGPGFRRGRYGSAGQGLAPGVLRRVCSIVEDRLSGPLRVADLAAAARLSEFHFLRAFKRATGITPHRYVTRRRIELAKLLLLAGQMPVAEVGWRAGFASPSHFAAQFRKHAGASPAAWRNRSCGVGD